MFANEQSCISICVHFFNVVLYIFEHFHIWTNRSIYMYVDKFLISTPIPIFRNIYNSAQFNTFDNAVAFKIIKEQNTYTCISNIK